MNYDYRYNTLNKQSASKIMLHNYIATIQEDYNTNKTWCVVDIVALILLITIIVCIIIVNHYLDLQEQQNYLNLLNNPPKGISLQDWQAEVERDYNLDKKINKNSENIKSWIFSIFVIFIAGTYKNLGGAKQYE